MAKPIISNTILAVVAAGVLFFIGQSVYDVFTRAPVKAVEGNPPPGNSSQPGQSVSGTIQLPAQPLPEQTNNANMPPLTSTPEPESVTEKPVTENETTAENETITENNESEPHALKTNPDLRQVIPPVPLAPPNPLPAPAAPASDEQLFQATDNLNNALHPSEDAFNNNFPVPQSSFPAPGANPTVTPESTSFETGEGSPFGNFPAPIDNNPGNGTNNFNATEADLERLRSLRQQKEQLRNDLGF